MTPVESKNEKIFIVLFLLGLLCFNVNTALAANNKKSAAANKKKERLTIMTAVPIPEGPIVQIINKKALDEINRTIPAKLPKEYIAPCEEGYFAQGRVLYSFGFSSKRIYQFSACKIPRELQPAVNKFWKYIRETRETIP
jgi:hypothetical protein